MHNENKVPLIRLAKRDMMEPWKVWCIRLASIVLALLLGGLVMMIALPDGATPIDGYATIITGALGKKTAIRQTVKANEAWVPPYGSGASLYLRPYMFGIDPIIGVKPATEFQFRVFGTPVGPYFKGGIKPLTIRVSDLDRAAPRGTGHIKAGLNYAMSLYNIVDAHEQGYDENLYVDSATRTHIEETGGANILFVTKEGKLVVPKSATILPSITRRSLIQVARDYLHLEVEERVVGIDELGDFAEAGLCGTAAVISPIGKIVDHGKEYTYAGMGNVVEKLYKTLTGIQMGTIEAPEGWIMVID